MSRADRDRKKIVVPEHIFWLDDGSPSLMPAQTIIFEHSLASIRQWEMRWHHPYFLETRKKTDVEMLDYLYCMTVNDVDPRAYSQISPEQMDAIKKYMDDPRTAKRMVEDEETKKKNRGKRMTCEDFYSAIVLNRLNMECEHWHINSLVALLNDLAEKQSPKKSTPKNVLKDQHKAINAAYRKAHKY